MSNKFIFVTMFITFIIVIYKKNSPFKIFMYKSPKGSISDTWASKHCLLFFLLFFSFLFLFFLFLDLKGVTYVNLICRGIL